MRAFLLFLSALLIAFLIGAIISYPAFQLASTLGDFAFHRVASRFAMLVLGIELFWLFKYLKIRSKRDFGYGLPWRQFLLQSVIWGVIGFVSAIPAAAFILGAGIRVLDSTVVMNAGTIFHLFLVGLGSGIAVALLEETVMRGGLHTAVERESGPWVASIFIAALFAIMHFFARVKIPASDVNWFSGFDLIAKSLAPLADPLSVLDSFLAWLVVFSVLSLTRVLTGNIAVAIGLHAGWVIVLRMLTLSTHAGTSTLYGNWVGKTEGLVGYWTLPWGITLALLLWITRHLWVRYARSP